MGSGVNNTVLIIIVRQVFTVIAVKCELQYLHTRISAFFDHFADRRCNHTQILCDHLFFAQLHLHRCKQFEVRSLFPVTIDCGFVSVRNREICLEATEMIYADDIVEAIAITDS